MLHKIAQSFNSAALSYDQHALIQKDIAVHLAQLLGCYSKPSSICEIGCGTGFLTSLLSQKFPDVPYLATDIAPAMVEKCRQNFSFPLLSFEVMDGENFPFEAQRSWIVSSMTFQWFHHIEKALFSLWERTHELLAFSIIMDGSFSAWNKAYEKIGMSSKLLPFLSKEAIYKLCRALPLAYVHISHQSYVQHFNTPFEFLHHLKRIGAHSSNQTPCPSVLRRVIRSFPDGIALNYEIAYCFIKKR